VVEGAVVSISHFNDQTSPFAPCGKQIKLCNWTTGRDLISCAHCWDVLRLGDVVESLECQIDELCRDLRETREALRRAECEQ
jgi:hypothetical protein